MLFGHPTLEPVSRKMLNFGVDDYLITPGSPEEMQQMFGAPPMQIASAGTEDSSGDENNASLASASASLLHGLPIANILLDSMLNFPHDAPGAAIQQINALIGPTMTLSQTASNQPHPAPPEGSILLSHLMRCETAEAGVLHLQIAARRRRSRRPAFSGAVRRPASARRCRCATVITACRSWRSPTN